MITPLRIPPLTAVTTGEVRVRLAIAYCQLSNSRRSPLKYGNTPIRMPQISLRTVQDNGFQHRPTPTAHSPSVPRRIRVILGVADLAPSRSIIDTARASSAISWASEMPPLSSLAPMISSFSPPGARTPLLSPTSPTSISSVSYAFCSTLWRTATVVRPRCGSSDFHPLKLWMASDESGNERIVGPPYRAEVGDSCYMEVS